MKLHISALAAVLLMAAAPYFPVFAEEAPAEEAPPAEETPAETRPEDMFTYTLNTADRAQITDFTVSDTFQGELVIPDTLDGHEIGYIDNAAFMNAKGITSISLPSTVTDMGNSVFFGCENLERFIVREGNPYFTVTDDGVLLADSNQLLVAYPAAKAGDSYTIPSTVDEIAPGAFGFAQNLKEVIIPDSTVYIDKWAFAYSKLEKINIPGHVMQIDDYGFAYCENLHDVTLNSGLETIYDAAFSCCSALTQITIPNTVTYIGQAAFAGTGLTSVTIPMSVSEIDYCAFGYDKDLHQIHTFTIYGETGSTAQSYCTESDPENDYQNQFTFIAIDNADEPQEVPAPEMPAEENPETPADSGADSPEDTGSAAEEVPETDSSTAFAQEENGETNLTDVIGPEIKDNQFLQIVLATVGGIAVILAVTLIILVTKKPKKSSQKDDDK